MVVTPDGHKVHFGQRGYEDYTTHKDHDRMRRYLVRHHNAETWSKRGINTPGFWSRWILWNKPSLLGSIRHTKKKFRIKIEFGKS